MRRKSERVLSFVGRDEDLPKTVREFREKYKGISRVLDEAPEVLDLVHRDLTTLSEGGPKGRESDFTSETLLRALLVMMVEGLSYRETVVRIGESDFLQDFIRTRKKAVMDHTFLNRAFKAIRPQTWKRVNAALGQRSVASAAVDPAVIRVDTTVVETNIHWPTDSSLLWDTWRVASRIMRRGRDLVAKSCPHRFHDRKIKRLHLTITRYSSSPSKKRQRQVERDFRTLIDRVAWIVEITEAFCQFAQAHRSLPLTALGLELEPCQDAREALRCWDRRSAAGCDCKRRLLVADIASVQHVDASDVRRRIRRPLLVNLLAPNSWCR
jgi:IS5 family transposase